MIKIWRTVFLHPQILSRENLHKPLFIPLFQHGICLVSFSSGAILFMSKVIDPLFCLPVTAIACLSHWALGNTYLLGTAIWLFKTWVNCLPRKVMKILEEPLFFFVIFFTVFNVVL